jgi:predicted permease
MKSRRRDAKPTRAEAPASPAGRPAERLYRRFLWLYPRSYRREYGGAMVEMFARRESEVAGTGTLARLRFLARETGGVIAGAARERFGAARRLPRRRNGTVAGTAGTAGPAGPAGRDPAPPRPRPSSSPRRPHLRGLPEALARELGHAVRRLRRSPGFTLTAVLTLALGIGGNAAIFAVVDGIVLSPLPYPDADRLVRVAADVEAVDAHGIEIPISFWLGYRDLNQTFDEIGLFEQASVNLSGEGEPEKLTAVNATGSLFITLGVPPALGRPITEDDEAPGAPLVVVLSGGLWARRFGADRAIVGRTIHLDGLAAEVVGVMPAAFAFPRPGTQVWLPLTIDRGRDPQVTFSYSSIGRMSEGVSIERAQQDLARATRGLPERFGNISEDFIDTYGVSPSLQSYKDTVIGDVADTLWVLLGALGFVLLIACANVANLFLVRAEARRREVGMRAALGASRADLVRYLLSESFVIGGLAGIAGLALALGAVRSLVAFGPAELPRLDEVGIGAAELGFTAIISLLVSVAFGLLPIVRLARGVLLDALRGAGGRSASGARSWRPTSLLVAGQVSLGLLLVFGAALFARSFTNLARIDPGFDADDLLTFRLSLPAATYPGAARRALFHQELLDRLEALPGVEAAGLARCLPLQGWCGGNPVSSPDSPLPAVAFRDIASIKRVSPGYFRALGIALARGRAIERRDHETPTGAAVISAALADRLFPGMDPIGKRVYPSEEGPADAAGWYTVVGVAATVKRVELDEEPAETLYVPMLGTDGLFLPQLDDVVVALRAAGAPATWAAAVREAVWSIDEDVPVAAIEPMADILSRASARVLFTATLIGIAALTALLLGAVGIYGVVSHSVGRRTAEIGVRMALGARRREVLRMVLRQGLAIALVGVAVGVAGALALARFLRSLLYEVSPSDPLTLAMVATGLIVAAALASYVPARRAARVDPATALKRE